MKSEPSSSALHVCNKHRTGYDFVVLVKAHPILSQYVRPNAYGDDSIDFANPQAVKALNQALLKHYYGVAVWDIPKNYLCPPIPGRADYLHYLADLLAETLPNLAPEQVRLLDIGTGANLVYPLIAAHAYGWQCVGVDIDSKALSNAQQIIDANGLQQQISLRQQPKPESIFKGVILPGEQFTLTLCNPPFHASAAEALAGTQRKWRGLGKKPPQALNFGGQSNELFCAGGEAAFLTTMISESRLFTKQCVWFTTLVSKSTNLPLVYRELKKAQAVTVKTVEMAQGQKQSRFVAWTFQPELSKKRI
ncbi:MULTISPECIES: 23S rRNA (adenine(1618)-N(6))-methyltransferase RlmF [unclassified Methylophilus]|uniref:23S rRNA (adenine(1618)-N(6))-methyltransferase RlmF n=1 Tax=unclassified Methylophilus TaxID=2630143 RepID=UPI0006F69CFD|nr:MULTISPECIES: 23S rRNA (adenine(1618)-N(6))-methyltransferase RlmF [unclassified Methylophilus]KQT41702.1 23S rRNA methyltransferase [Methylophilus sp. Leaf416]KQT55869.1 23S rRNA methyltransferase [Methylophilus sp. Leaf459]